MRPAVLFLALLALVVARSVGASANPIPAENALPGDPGWVTEPAPFRDIEGYASEVSAAPGDTIHFHVSTDQRARYRIVIYRLGWYGGAGGRLMTCLPSCTTDEQGMLQPVPAFAPATGYLAADWPVTDTLMVPADWVSGYYLAKLVLTTGASAGRASTVPLIIREARLRPAAILVQAATNTWQAYNDWGGRSLYSNRMSGVGANHVSFDRPYVYGEHDLFDSGDIQLVRFLEREGYDVSYTTNVDIDRDPVELLRHRLFVSAGHDEYWSKGIRDALEAALSAGTNLAFTGGNVGYWQIRYEDNRRTLVEYRDPARDPEPDPALKTTRFRGLRLSRPECDLLGVEFSRGIGAEGSFAINPSALSDPWLRGTGIVAGATFPYVGDEWDSVEPGCNVPPPTVLFHYDGPPAPGDMIRYVANSGARVFAAGFWRFSWALDDYRTGKPADPRLQVFMRNALNDLTRPAPPTQVSAVATPDGILIHVAGHPDPRIRGIAVFRYLGSGPVTRGAGVQRVCLARSFSCLDSSAPPGNVVRYAAVLLDPWRASHPTATATGIRVPIPRRHTSR